MVARNSDKMIRLPADFVPSKFSVLCGRGKKCTASSGNRHLRKLIDANLKPYSEARTKIEKSSIVSAIIEEVRSLCQLGSFVKLENDVWWEVDDAFAREKIGCVFRDILHTHYRSSTKAKQARKKEASKKPSSGSKKKSKPSYSVSKKYDDYTPPSTYRMPELTVTRSGRRSRNRGFNQGVERAEFSTYDVECSCANQDTQKSQNVRMDDYFSLLSNYLDENHPPEEKGSRQLPEATAIPDFPSSIAADFILQESCDVMTDDNFFADLDMLFEMPASTAIEL